MTSRLVGRVLDSPIDVLDWDTALERILDWAKLRESRYVCICNAHSVVTASRDDSFNAVIAGADMATPDGMPVAWLLRRGGFRQQGRISGPDLMPRLCSSAEDLGVAVALFGSTPETLDKLRARFAVEYPRLRISEAISPPFRPLSFDEDAAIRERLNASGAGIIFVSLGCPKQERWMAANRGQVSAVMIGVGAAFDFHAGVTARAPDWMQQAGLEWLHRLASEPRRLWRRYLVTNTLFLVSALRQLWQDSQQTNSRGVRGGRQP